MSHCTLELSYHESHAVWSLLYAQLQRGIVDGPNTTAALGVMYQIDAEATQQVVERHAWQNYLRLSKRL